MEGKNDRIKEETTVNLVVIGAQWGDEGKGKIVDFLAAESDIVLRFSGGSNAGHTIVRGDTQFVFHLLPSGILYENVCTILGSGMVIDPEILFHELRTLENAGINWKGRVFISDRAHIVLPRYKSMDKEMESQRTYPIGTTGRGIGIAYSLKASRDGIRLADTRNDRIIGALEKEDREFLNKFDQDLMPLLVSLPEFLHGQMSGTGKSVLLEGAQGVMLDLDLGTYPFVSSGCSAASGACAGSGLGPRSLNKIIAVFKSYSTRVGNGPFPSEFRDSRDGDLAERIREIAHEYGATTGRARRCGYLDLVALRYACQTNSVDNLILTHLDVYDSFDEIHACTAYTIDGKHITSFPSSLSELERVEPVLQKFSGWKTDISTIRSYNKLPKEAREYISFIEEYTKTSISIISTGADRDKIIIREELWNA